MNVVQVEAIERTVVRRVHAPNFSIKLNSIHVHFSLATRGTPHHRAHHNADKGRSLILGQERRVSFQEGNVGLSNREGRKTTRLSCEDDTGREGVVCCTRTGKICFSFTRRDGKVSLSLFFEKKGQVPPSLSLSSVFLFFWRDRKSFSCKERNGAGRKVFLIFCDFYQK